MAEINDIKAVDVAKPEPDDERMYSVTTIIGVLDKPALVYWAAAETAEAAVKQAKYLPQRIEAEGKESVVKALGDARFKPAPGQRTATALGTAVHEALEEYALTGIMPESDDEVQPFLEQADRWMQKFQPEFLASEMTCYSPSRGFAGTLDTIFKVDGVTFLGDFKTSRKARDGRGKPTTPYPEQVGLQLSAYRYSEFAAAWQPRRYEYQRRRYYLLGAEERAMSIPVPEVDTCCVVHITPEHCEAFPIQADERAFEAFLYTLECYRWVNDLSKTIMGDPLEK